MIPRISSWLPNGLPTTFEHLTRPALRPFSSTTIAAAASTNKKPVPRFADPYANKHAEARRAANVARQAVLRKQRAEALGDPIRGVPTAFVQSFDTAVPPPSDPSSGDSASTTANGSNLNGSIQTASGLLHSPRLPPLSIPKPPKPEAPLLNHFVTPTELASSLSISHTLTVPLPPENPEEDDPEDYARRVANHKKAHTTAATALPRILALSNASSKHRTRANTRRCIATFGRHETDKFLKPRPATAAELDPDVYTARKTPRAGADTGSSEVQIAILTAKIRVLADRYEGVNRNDKVNKRNLRLLLHRRQKLLKYMERKERGGERWRYMLGLLGLTEATWKGQIAVQ